MMAEQREPGWFWVRPQGEPLSPVEWKGYWEGLLGEEPVEIGERIPHNEELIALWAVVRWVNVYMNATTEREENQAIMQWRDPLARLGERK